MLGQASAYRALNSNQLSFPGTVSGKSLFYESLSQSAFDEFAARLSK